MERPVARRPAAAEEGAAHRLTVKQEPEGHARGGDVTPQGPYDISDRSGEDVPPPLATREGDSDSEGPAPLAYESSDDEEGKHRVYVVSSDEESDEEDEVLEMTRMQQVLAPLRRARGASNSEPSARPNVVAEKETEDRAAVHKERRRNPKAQEAAKAAPKKIKKTQRERAFAQRHQKTAAKQAASSDDKARATVRRRIASKSKSVGAATHEQSSRRPIAQWAAKCFEAEAGVSDDSDDEDEAAEDGGGLEGFIDDAPEPKDFESDSDSGDEVAAGQEDDSSDGNLFGDHDVAEAENEVEIASSASSANSDSEGEVEEAAGDEELAPAPKRRRLRGKQESGRLFVAAGSVVQAVAKKVRCRDSAQPASGRQKKRKAEKEKVAKARTKNMCTEAGCQFGRDNIGGRARYQDKNEKK